MVGEASPVEGRKEKRKDTKPFGTAMWDARKKRWERASGGFVAELLGYTPAKYYSYESSRFEPSLDVLADLVRLYRNFPDLAQKLTQAYEAETGKTASLTSFAPSTPSSKSPQHANDDEIEKRTCKVVKLYELGKIPEALQVGKETSNLASEHGYHQPTTAMLGCPEQSYSRARSNRKSWHLQPIISRRHLLQSGPFTDNTVFEFWRRAKKTTIAGRFLFFIQFGGHLGTIFSL